MAESKEHIERVRSQFTRQAEAYSQLQQTRDEEGLALLVALTEAQPNHRVLDVACGPGFLTMAFASKCRHATGVDATPELLSRARTEAARRGLQNVDFGQGDAGSLRFADGLFDVVSCRAAFHHFGDPAHVLAEMKRVTKPGGRLLVADMLTSEDRAQADYHNRIERLCDPSHVRALPGSELEHMFREAGLSVLRGGERPVEWDLEEWMAHGGPGPEAAREIVALMEASLEADLSGLNVHRENGRLKFSHVGAAFVLERSSQP